MENNFWQKLKAQGEPIMVLAPMADVTDAAFRRIIAKYGKPDVTWTEFVSADGLALAPEEGKKKLMLDLIYTEEERPIVAQFFSSRPENMEYAARLARELGFDGIDINMGCPDKSIEKQGAGAAHIKNPKLAREMIRAAKRGARSTTSGQADLPVSVKTRAGYNKEELETWLPELLAEEPAVITLHARTRKEMSKVPARWSLVKRAVEIRDAMGKSTLIFGNGDLKDIEDACEKVRVSGADGAMLGRAIFGNPWLFAKGQTLNTGSKGLTLEERLNVMVEHTRAFEELLGHQKSFAIMKKHYKAYLSGIALATSGVAGFEGSTELRHKLMEAANADEVASIVEDFLGQIRD